MTDSAGWSGKTEGQHGSRVLRRVLRVPRQRQSNVCVGQGPSDCGERPWERMVCMLQCDIGPYTHKDVCTCVYECVCMCVCARSCMRV